MNLEKVRREFKRKRNIYGHEIILPKVPLAKDIHGYNLKKSDQKFIPLPLPEKFNDWDKHRIVEFTETEWEKIHNGVWFFNNGNLEYVTGIHYFYLNWWKIKASEEGKPKIMRLPSFNDADRDFFYLWDKVEKSDKILGLAFITNRRDGKSYKASLIAYLAALMNDTAEIGIQSSTEPDAKNVMKKIITSWKLLPYIFRPLDNGETSPTKSLRFSEPSKKDTKTAIKKRIGDTYTNSIIDYKSSESFAYDGHDLLRLILDEFGKPQNSDTNVTLQVVSETMMDGSTIIGKVLAITTVEDIESKKEDEGVKGVWNGADMSRLNPFGMTNNGLIQYFKPSFHGMRGDDEHGVPFIDEYGYSDWRRAKRYREKIRSALKGQALISEIRKYPFSIDEAFQTIHGCYFNEEHINDFIKYNKAYVNEDNVFRGNFRWRTDITNPEVYWQPDPEGKFYASWFPDKKDRNKWQWEMTEEGRHRSPIGVSIRGGVDPFDHRITVDDRASDAGFHLFKKSGVWDGGEKKDPFSNTFILEYICRPPTPEEMYEDVLMASIFYGARILAENNKSGIVNFFRTNGYFDYLLKRPESTHTDYSRKRTVERGIALSGDVPRKNLPNRLMSYVHVDMAINEDGSRNMFLPFNRTLESWKAFNPMKWTEYDATVSSMLALVASDVEIKLDTQQEFSKPIIPKFDNSGIVSTYIGG